MLPENTHAARVSLRWPTPLDPEKVQSSVSLLYDWRQGGAATAVVMAALLPFAVAWHMTYLVVVAASLIGAVAIAAGCHVVRELRLNALLIFPEFALLPELASKRKRLVSPSNRRTVVNGLRRAVAPTQPFRRVDCCPVLPDRVMAVRSAVLQLASALERNTNPDPASVALMRELLRDGCSPLYNPNVPVDDLRRAITRASAGIAAKPRSQPLETGRAATTSAKRTSSG